MRPVLLHSIALTNLLSYGPGEAIALGPLNVLIGPNGSGKSNLIDAVNLLRATTSAKGLGNLAKVAGWIREGESGKSATLTALVGPSRTASLRYSLRLVRQHTRLVISDERIERASDPPQESLPGSFAYYGFDNGHPRFSDGPPTIIGGNEIQLNASILAQVAALGEDDKYTEIKYLSRAFGSIRIYRDWVFGRKAPARQKQRTNLRSDFLNTDCLNVALVLKGLHKDPIVKERLLAALKDLYAGIDDFKVVVEKDLAQIFIQEGRVSIPSNRLSDGTLRYLCLLAILCHPKPPPLICIEEPELGLHTDVMPTIARLLIEASTRTQIIVTTHSDVLVDALSETPESVLVFDKVEGATKVHRLEKEKLEKWLKLYRLGTLWTMGRIGGNRW